MIYLILAYLGLFAFAYKWGMESRLVTHPDGGYEIDTDAPTGVPAIVKWGSLTAMGLYAISYFAGGMGGGVAVGTTASRNSISNFLLDTPTISEISRDVGSRAGGTILYLTGTKFRDGATVFFGDSVVNSDSISDTDDTLWTTTPSYVQTNIFDTVDIIVSNTGGNKDTLLAGFEFGPAIDSTYGFHGFEDSTNGVFTSPAFGGDGFITYPSGDAKEGSRYASHTVTSGSGNNDASYLELIIKMVESMKPEGIFIRYWTRVDSVACNRAQGQGAQVKMVLQRDGGQNPPSWMHNGIGFDFGGSNCSYELLKDATTGPITEKFTHNFVHLEWVEMLQWVYRDTINSRGRVRLWLGTDDRLKLFADTADISTGFGNDTPTDNIDFQIGIVYNEETTGSETMRIDNDGVIISDGIPIN